VPPEAPDLDAQRCAALIRRMQEEGCTTPQIRAVVESIASSLLPLVDALLRPHIDQMRSNSSTGITCAAPVDNVPLGEKMSQCGRIRELKGPWVVKVGPSWVAMWREYVWTDGGRKPKVKKKTLGRIADMTEQQLGSELEIIRSARRTSKTPAVDITISEFYERHFLPEHIRKRAPATQDHLISIFRNYILPKSALGGIEIREASLAQLQQHCDLILEAGKAGTVPHVRSALTSMFKRAMAHGIIDRNPAAGILLPRNLPHKELTAPALQQARPLLVSLADPSVAEKYMNHRRAARTRRMDPLQFQRVRLMVLLDCALAMGYGETAGLRLSCLNLTSQVVTRGNLVLPPRSLAVSQTYSRAGRFGPPKTKARRRVLPLSDALVDAFQILIQETKPDDAVFGSADKPIDYDTSLRVLKAAGRPAGIPWINWHSLRRFFANISLQLDIPLEIRQYIMGHKFAAMTQHYTTVPEIERMRPYVEQITRALLDADATEALPAISKLHS
jgi:integrase